MHEIETKVLEIDVDNIEEKLRNLGAKKISDTLLTVDLLRSVGTKNGEDKWFLRVRSYNKEKVEVTWKAISEHIGVSRKHKEINFEIEDHDKMVDLFCEIGLEKYAHQEKKRISWKLENTQFDIDIYPCMIPFVEIESDSVESIDDFIKKLNLENHETWNDGERTLIENKYKLDWCDMKF